MFDLNIIFFILFVTILFAIGGLWIYSLLQERQKFRQVIDFAIEGMVISHKGNILDVNAQDRKSTRLNSSH